MVCVLHTKGIPRATQKRRQYLGDVRSGSTESPMNSRWERQSGGWKDGFAGDQDEAAVDNLVAIEVGCHPQSMDTRRKRWAKSTVPEAFLTRMLPVVDIHQKRRLLLQSDADGFASELTFRYAPAQ